MSLESIDSSAKLSTKIWTFGGVADNPLALTGPEGRTAELSARSSAYRPSTVPARSDARCDPLTSLVAVSDAPTSYPLWSRAQSSVVLSTAAV
jgi:hypothetical protein